MEGKTLDDVIVILKI